MKYFSFTRYDVWLVDWRTSCNLPLTQVESKYTLDDCAAYDYPAAIDKVLEVTNKVIKYLIFQQELSTTMQCVRFLLHGR